VTGRGKACVVKAKNEGGHKKGRCFEKKKEKDARPCVVGKGDHERAFPEQTGKNSCKGWGCWSKKHGK